MTTDWTGPDDRAPVLRLSAVRRAFGDDIAVDGLDLTVRGGEIHAVVGLNGAGKSTLMRLALGMLRPDAGTVGLRLAGLPEVAAWRAPACVWSAVGHLVEAPFAYPELTVVEMVRAAARLRGLSREDAGPAAGRVVRALELTRWADRSTSALSMGNRQRLGLACAAVHRPRLLVLDEPTTALDPAGVLLVRTWLLDTRDSGTGVLISSHHLDEVARTADRITVIHRGRAIGTLHPRGVDLERQFFAMVYAAERQLLELASHHDNSAFSQDERLVLDYATSMTATPCEVSDELFARLAARFGERELVELTAAVALENLRARFNWALGIPAQGFVDGTACARPDASALAEAAR